MVRRCAWVDLPGLRPGAIVRSLAGRDRGTPYIVLRLVDERRVAVINGRQRTADRPKVKNRKHLEVLGWAPSELALRLERGDRVPDSDIVKALEALPTRVLEEV
jgi:large subunit ribosomal protein L14e